MALEMQ